MTTDITYPPFGKSMLYLSTIMDTFNSEIVAYKISDHPDTKLAVDTLNQIDTFPKGASFHSDQGSTHTSKEFYEIARKKTLSEVCPIRGHPQLTHQ
ncbi:DDE-type integrase/transposase/recombinase [Carnobacterium divergens]|uniref:DDE-type integrase/transposase/recombinase n=1 Tax=Carnobacterium divergens TaxID=2748 RepID=A0AAW8RB59_CARDV|nr:DDE-type integrase/transposase/recombinase [Carnobacterium divergens]MDT1974909.1 DDE-type integrase/transposase/recombinase [Carnobacterium divergens]MDT2012873.1 DDE-type integrase/transposase/recombinase [Carnobacterium divergens]